MQVDRLSVTLDPDLGAAVRKSAARAKLSVSAWIAEAAADRVRNELLGRALDRWEAESGALTTEELDAAARALGLGRPRKGARR
jgi:predicted transcriptional regulator